METGIISHYYYDYYIEIHSLLCMRFKNSIEQNHETYEFDETKTQNPSITSGENNHLGHADLFI